MRSTIAFICDGKTAELDFSKEQSLHPTTTLLSYLRALPSHKGVKEGCAQGDCGACTVVLAEPTDEGKLHYRAVDSCLLLLPMVDGKQVITVENLRYPSGDLHPVQEAVVNNHGSQCGFCTPGIVMSIFALFKRPVRPNRRVIEDALVGNLCRCTGYRPIVDAAVAACRLGPLDHFTPEEHRLASLLAALPHDSIEIKAGKETYIRPATLEEASQALHAAPDACVIAGATDIALRLTRGHEHLETIIDLGAIGELKEITQIEGGMEIGAGVPLADLLPSAREEYPGLAEMLSLFGSLQIRNLATLGGNLGTASPIGDTLPVLIACHARVILQSIRGRRELALEGFFSGYRKTLRAPDELIVAVRLPYPDGALVRSYKVSKRRDLDIATVSAGFRLEVGGGDTVRALTLAYGGMVDRTRRATLTEQHLIGKKWSRENVEQASVLLDRDFDPISDVRGSAEFRKLAARNLLLKFYLETKA